MKVVKFKEAKTTFVKEGCKDYGNKYDYSKIEYINNSTKVCINCPKHGEFWQTPNKHLRGDGCPICRVNKKLTLDNFIEKAKLIHGEKYDYSKVVYKNVRTKVCITCPVHGEFWQIPANHLQGNGCPDCYHIKSKLEENIENFLIVNNILYERQKQFEWLKIKWPLYLDFYLPEYNVAIECQGEQHFKPIKYFGGIEKYEKTLKRDKIKFSLCNKHNIIIFYFSDKKYDGIITDKNKLLEEIKKYGRHE